MTLVKDDAGTDSQDLNQLLVQLQAPYSIMLCWAISNISSHCCGYIGEGEVQR